MGPKTLEQLLWEDLHNVPVTNFNRGRIQLLDIFAQDGRSYRLRNIVGAGDGEPFRRRVLKRIGSMLTLGDTTVDGWDDERIEEISDTLMDLKVAEVDIQDEPFSRKSDPPDLILENVAADSKATMSLFGFVEGSFDKHASLKVKIRTPFYHRFEEDHLVSFLCGDSPQWKPNLKRVGEVERKGTSFWGSESEHLELWIVTELRFGTIEYTTEKSRGAGAAVAIPGSDVLTMLPAAVKVNVSSSNYRSRQTDAPADQGDVLYGFKAVRVKFDKEGNYVSNKGGDMGHLSVHATRGDDDDELNPDKDPERHMGAFVHANSGDAGCIGGFECAELLLGDDEEDIELDGDGQ